MCFTLSCPRLGGVFATLFLGFRLTKDAAVFALEDVGKGNMSQPKSIEKDLVAKIVMVDLWPQVVCSPDLGPALPPHN